MITIRHNLIYRSVIHRPRRAASLFLLSFCFSCLSTLLLAGGASYIEAVRQGTQASFGGYTYQITGSSDTTRTIMEEASADGQVVAVIKTTGAVTSAETGQAAGGDTFELSGPSRYGVLITGQYPQQPGEVSVSQQVADQLRIGVADEITLEGEDADFGPEPYKVTAITMNPASTKESSISAVTRSDTIRERAVSWLTDESFSYSQQMQQEFNSGNARLGHIDWSIRQSEEEIASRGLSGMPYYEILITVATVVALTGLILSNRGVYQRTVEGLIASGESVRRAWWLALAGSYLVAFLGVMLGLALCQTLLGIAKKQVSGLFEQSWANVNYTGLVQAVLLLFLCLGIVILVSFLFLTRKTSHQPANEITIRYSIHWVLAVVGSLTCLFFVWTRITLRILEGHYLALWTGSFAIPLLFLAIPFLRRYRIERRALAMRNTNNYLGLAGIFALCFYAASYSSFAMTQVNWQRGSIEGVSSYMTIELLTSNDVDYLSQRYPDIMDEAYILIDPNETSSLIRVIRADAVPCAQEQAALNGDFDTCESYSMSPVSLVSPEGKSGELAGHVAPDFSSSAEKAGIVYIEPGTSYLNAASTTTYGEVDVLLESDALPGMVLEEGSAQAKELGIEPSTIRTIYVPNFSRFSDEDKNSFRSAVIGRAGYAFVTESDSPELRQLEARAITYSGIAGIASVLFITVMMVTARQEQRILRQSMYLAGDSPWQRIRLAFPIIIPFLGTVFTAAILGRIAAMDHVPLLEPDLTYHNHGIWWPIPLYLAAAASVVALVHSSRKPTMEDAS